MTVSQTPATSLASVGAALRQVRNARSFSLADVADATGSPRRSSRSSRTTERHHDRPPRPPDRLLRHLDHRPAAVRGAPRLPGGDPPGERRSLQSPVEGIDIYLLTPDTDRQMMPLEVLLPAGRSRLSPAATPARSGCSCWKGSSACELEGAEPRVLGRATRRTTRPSGRTCCRTRATRAVLRVLCVDTPPTMYHEGGTMPSAHMTSYPRRSSPGLLEPVRRLGRDHRRVREGPRRPGRLGDARRPPGRQVSEHRLGLPVHRPVVVDYGDRQETGIVGGQAYYIEPGHHSRSKRRATPSSSRPPSARTDARGGAQAHVGLTGQPGSVLRTWKWSQNERCVARPRSAARCRVLGRAR